MKNLFPRRVRVKTYLRKGKRIKGYKAIRWSKHIKIKGKELTKEDYIGMCNVNLINNVTKVSKKPFLQVYKEIKEWQDEKRKKEKKEGVKREWNMNVLLADEDVDILIHGHGAVV